MARNQLVDLKSAMNSPVLCLYLLAQLIQPIGRFVNQPGFDYVCPLCYSPVPLTHVVAISLSLSFLRLLVRFNAITTNKGAKQLSN